jgi:Flp pilus assembly protein TadB
MDGSGLSLLDLAAAGAVLGTALALWLPRWLEDRPAGRVRRRLAELRRHRDDAVAPAPAATPDLFAGTRTGRLGRSRAALAEAATRLGGTPVLRGLLLASLVAGIAILVSLRAIGPFGPLLTSALTLAGAAAVIVAGWNHLLRRWQVAFLEGFADAIDLLTRAVRSGIPVAEAIRLAAKEAGEPVRGEFQKIAHALDLGIDLKDAMRKAARRVRLPDFDFLVVTLVIQRESGGQLAETLDGLSTILRRRKEIRLKMRALTAEGRMTALIVSALPILAGLGMYAIDPDYILQLFRTDMGRILLYIGSGCLVLGTLVVRHMTRARP